MQDLIFIQPVFKHRIWGGNQLATVFNFSIPHNKIGEAWLISAHKNGDCLIQNPRYKNMTLSQLWAQHPELFNSKTKGKFPLMIKIIDATADLSVQVHPDDEFAQQHENDTGKEECWYILAAEPEAQIIHGHNAKSSTELNTMIKNNQWDKLLNYTKVKAGEFFNVPTGTIHAIKSGLLILEVQQSSDITYRIYDYNRTDEQGNLRELHLEKAQQVIKTPHCIKNNSQDKILVSSHNLRHTRLIKNKYFTVEKLINSLTNTIPKPNTYWLINIIEGSGKINHTPVSKGHSLIVPCVVDKLTCEGDLSLIISYESNE